MSLAAVNRLSWRMARRNHLYLFAWLCATALPLGLQLMAGAIDEVHDYLEFYYGALTLWMFFSLTYGFAAVFVSYYLVSSLRRAGTLDLLRVSGVKPWQVTGGVFAQLQLILIPPMLGFVAIFAIYLTWFGERSLMQGASFGQTAGFALAMLCNEALLAVVPCLALYRNEGGLALIAMLLVPVFNAFPIVFLYMLHWPAPLYVLMMLSILSLLLLLSALMLQRLWPAQHSPRRGS